MALVTLNLNPPRAQLRSFGLIGVAAFGLLGLLIYLRQHFMFWSLGPQTAATTAYVLWGLAGACGVCALLAPMVLKPLFVGLMVVGFPIGVCISLIAMAIIYFIILTPLGLIFRIIGRDALHRRLNASAATYWIPREHVVDVRRYYRQF